MLSPFGLLMFLRVVKFGMIRTKSNVVEQDTLFLRVVNVVYVEQISISRIQNRRRKECV